MYELPNLKRIVIQKTGSVVLKRTRSKALAKLARMPRTPLFAVASVVEDGVLYFGYSPRRAKAVSLVAHVAAGAPGGVMGMAGGAAFWGLREGVRYVW